MATITGDQYYDSWNSTSIIVVVTASMAVFNSCELLIVIGARFTRRRSLLYISLNIASFGVVPYFMGFLMEYFRWTAVWVAYTFTMVGWVTMVTGQSVVLYSRLGLILNDHRILKAVRVMIIADAILFHTTTAVALYGKAYSKNNQKNFLTAMFFVEKAQMTGFCIQEFIISGLYLWKAVGLLTIITKRKPRNTMIELLTINVVMILGNIALLILEYSGQRVMERAWKGLVYSVKLKLEFAILTELAHLVRSRPHVELNTFADTNCQVNSLHEQSRNERAVTKQRDPKIGDVTVTPVMVSEGSKSGRTWHLEN